MAYGSFFSVVVTPRAKKWRWARDGILIDSTRINVKIRRGGFGFGFVGGPSRAQWMSASSLRRKQTVRLFCAHRYCTANQDSIWDSALIGLSR